MKSILETIFRNTNREPKIKFQIACQGNSYAGSLAWNLLSNSVCFSTCHENHCNTYINPRENIDYISIEDDYSDLEEKIKYYTENETEAATIAKNGLNYVKFVLDNTDKLTKKTLKWVRNQYDYSTLVDAKTILNQNLSKKRFRLLNNKFIEK